MAVTRFNPTANGDLHLGHVYMALFNERLAHENGGRFIVRFEDNQVDTLYTVTATEAKEAVMRQQEALLWLNLDVDQFIRQSHMEMEVKEFIAHHGWYIPEYRWPYQYPMDPTKGGDYIEDPGGYMGDWYAYAPYLTYMKVCYDALQGITVLVRGDDLRSEFTLYQHYRAQLGLKPIAHYYLPRLVGPNGETVSKFFDSTPILAYRDEGWRPDDLINLLAQSALKRPGNGWRLENVKRIPRLVAELGSPQRDNHRAGAPGFDPSFRDFESSVYPTG